MVDLDPLRGAAVWAFRFVVWAYQGFLAPHGDRLLRRIQQALPAWVRRLDAVLVLGVVLSLVGSVGLAAVLVARPPSSHGEAGPSSPPTLPPDLESSIATPSPRPATLLVRTPDAAVVDTPPTGELPAYILSAEQKRRVTVARQDVERLSGAQVLGSDPASPAVFDPAKAAGPCPDGADAPRPPPRDTVVVGWHTTSADDRTNRVATLIAEFGSATDAFHYIGRLTRAFQPCGVSPAAAPPFADQIRVFRWSVPGRWRDLVVMRIGNLIIQVGTESDWAAHDTIADRLAKAALTNWGHVKRDLSRPTSPTEKPMPGLTPVPSSSTGSPDPVESQVSEAASPPPPPPPR